MARNTPLSSTALPSAEITVRRTESPKPEHVRYVVADAWGEINTTDMLKACDSDEVAAFMRTYYERHRRRPPGQPGRPWLMP